MSPTSPSDLNRPAAEAAAAATDNNLQALPEPYPTTTPRPAGLVNAAQATPRPLIVVLGGTGFIGLSVCERLVRRAGGGGQRVRVPTRRLVRGQTLQALPTVEIVVADINDDAMLSRSIAGADAVVNLVGTLHGSRAGFDALHRALPERLVRACRETGVRRIVHMSAIGAAADAPSNYLRSKAAGEAVLHAAGNDLEITILRSSLVYGVRDRLTNLYARMYRLLPFVAVPGGSTRLQPVWVEDVAEAVVRCVGARSTIGQTIECVGPQRMTFTELVRAVGRHTGESKAVVGLPDPLARLAAMVMSAAPGQPLLSLDALDTLRVDSIPSGQNADLSSLGIAPSALDAVAMQWLSDRAGPQRLDRWRAMR